MLSNTLIDIETILPDIHNDFLESDISTNIIENISKKTLYHKNTTEKQKKTKEETISYDEFWKGNINLKNFKIFQLKAFAKSNRLYVTGTKNILIGRIQTHFIKISSAIKIQRIFRGSIIRLSFKIRGPAFKNRKLCVNESDGFTLEPLSDIPFERFFSYTDSNNFIYGFDVMSLISLYKNKNKIVNPYTRERIDINLTNNILSLGKIIKIAYSYVLEDTEIEQPPAPLPTTINRRVLNNNAGLENRNNNILTPNYETIVENNILTPEQRIILQRVQEIRQETLDRRIQNLFVEIDSLGNYTDSSWFSTLNRRNYIRFYRCLYDIWNFRSQMPMEIKRQICQFRDPFSQIRNFNLIGLTDDELKQVCLSVMEEMIYTGIDNEYKKLGTLHVLSALTIVSFPARNSMIWLYESVIY